MLYIKPLKNIINSKKTHTNKWKECQNGFNQMYWIDMLFRNFKYMFTYYIIMANKNNKELFYYVF